MRDLNTRFSNLSTPLLADACVRTETPIRCAPAGLRPIRPNTRIAGRALPARHYGSVDVFLEAMHHAAAGDLLVIDNAGRMDEACIGDLTALEARASELSGMVVWGLHRDTDELVEIDFPVFSYGALPLGPLRVVPRDEDALELARFGDAVVSRDDAVFADDDGLLFVALDRVEQVLEAAREIRDKEREQARAVLSGKTLRDQLRFAEFLEERDRDPSLTLRRHLRRIGGAIEE